VVLVLLLLLRVPSSPPGFLRPSWMVLLMLIVRLCNTSADVAPLERKTLWFLMLRRQVLEFVVVVLETVCVAIV